jgi:hypothetical protein
LFSFVVGVVFEQVFSYTVGMGPWMGIAIFMGFLLLFLGFLARRGGKRDDERLNQLSEYRRLHAYDFEDEEEL